MKSQDILYSKGNNDECMTPPEVVLALLPFLEPFRGKRIWCPFDEEPSHFYQVLSAFGFDVVRSHINDGNDFYTYEPDHWDLLVSNPPFTNKRKIFERALSFGKPFALLMTNVWLNDAAPLKLFGEDLQLLMFPERINFLNPSGDRMGKPSFASSFYCKDFLPKPICVRRLATDVYTLR